MKFKKQSETERIYLNLLYQQYIWRQVDMHIFCFCYCILKSQFIFGTVIISKFRSIMFDDHQFDAQQVQSALPEYKFVKKLGVGAYGKVFLVRKIGQEKSIAMKKIKCFGLCNYQKSNATNEVRILASLDHPNIVRFQESFFDGSEEDLYIFMEYANQGDLSHIISEAKSKKVRISQSLIWRVISQLSEGLIYLHKNNIIHRDIKPANIFKSNGLFKLGDLNVSRILPSGILAKTQIGSPLYTSPQIWNSQNGYNQKCDIWSLGVVIYQLCTLKVPFQAHSIEELIRKLKTQRLKNIPNGYSSTLNELIYEMLQINPKKRISAEKIIQFCQKQGKYSKNEEIQIFAENMLQTIVLPETEHRWVNLVPLPPRMVRRQTGDSLKKDSSLQKKQFSLNRSNVFAPCENRSTIIRKSKNKLSNISQQKSRVRLPSIIKRNSSHEQKSKSKQRMKGTPQKSRKEIESVKCNSRAFIPIPNPQKKLQNYIKNGNDQNVVAV